MKSKLKTSLLFFAGLIVGAAAMFVFAGRANQQLWARCVANGTVEQAFIASELRTARHEDLRQRAEANLVPAVLAIHGNKDLQSVPESETALCAVKDFYEINRVPVPQEIAGILGALPTRSH